MTAIPGGGTVEKAFNAWRIATSISLHFKQNGGTGYDAIKFQFKVKHCSPAAFNKRNDRYFYERCVKTYPMLENLIDFFLANVLAGNTWVGQMNDDTYQNWLAQVQSISYRFKNELKLFRSTYERLEMTFDQALRVSEEYPQSIIIKMLLSNDLSLETVAVIDTFVSFLVPLRRNVEADPLGLFNDISNRILNYKIFLTQRINIKRLKLVALEALK